MTIHVPSNVSNHRSAAPEATATTIPLMNPRFSASSTTPRLPDAALSSMARAGPARKLETGRIGCAEDCEAFKGNVSAGVEGELGILLLSEPYSAGFFAYQRPAQPSDHFQRLSKGGSTGTQDSE